MKIPAIALLISGLIVETLGFVIDKSEVFRFTEPLVSPSFYAGRAAVNALKVQHEIFSDQRGFDVLAAIYIDRLIEINPPDIVGHIAEIEVRKIVLEEGLAFSARAAEMRRRLQFHLSNGKTGNWNLAAAESDLGELRSTAFTRASMFIFTLGALLQVIGFLHENSSRAAA